MLRVFENRVFEENVCDYVDWGKNGVEITACRQA